MAPDVYELDRLMSFAADLLRKTGVPADDAEVCARRLVEGDARGQRAHGMARLPAYIRRIEEGGLNPVASPRIVRETPISALIDGDNGLGPVVMTYSAEIASEKARENGLAWVGVRGSNHAGAGGVYAQLLVERNLIAILGAVANVNQMAPWGGTERLLGPNPLAISIPGGDEPPIVLDMATTTVSYGSVRQAVSAGRTLPEGWLIDSEGKPILDPDRADEGTLAPIGGYKGYGLSLVIAALAGTLNGGSAGSNVVDHYHDQTTPTNTGHFIICVDPELFRPLEDFTTEMDTRIREIRASKPQDGVDTIRIPGDGSLESRRTAASEGIRLSEDLLQELRALADRLGSTDHLAD